MSTASTQLRDHYDWIVMGDNPGALLGAALAARLGLSVLILPLAESRKTLVSKSGQCVDPETNFILGLARSSVQTGLLAECVAQLGILPAEEDLILGKERLSQVLTPAARVAVSHTHELLLEEFVREIGEEGTEALVYPLALKKLEADYQRYWRDLPERLTLTVEAQKGGSPKQLKSRPVARKGDLGDSRKVLVRQAHGKGISASVLHSSRTVEDFCRDLGHREYEPVCEGLWQSLTGGPAEGLTTLDLLRILTLARTGAGFRGGMTAYRDFLLRVAKRHGAHQSDKTECRTLFVENGRFVGVQVASKGNMIGAGGGILGASVHRNEGRVSWSGGHFRKKSLRALAPSGWKVTLALTVNSAGVAEGLCARALWKEARGPGLEIEVAHPSEYGLRDQENRLVFLRTVLPYTADTLGTERLRQVFARMLRKLTELAPYVEDHLVRIYPDFRAEKAAEEIAQIYGFTALEEIPDNLLHFGGEGLGASTGVEGLYLVSSESYPKLGSLGPTVAGLEAVAWLAHHTGLPGPFA